LTPDAVISGSLQRCKVDGDRGGKRSGAYRLFDDDFPTCAWWNWKTGGSGIWASLDRPLSNSERNLLRQRFEQARRERQEAQAAQWRRNSAYLARLWNSAQAITPVTPAGLYLAGRELMIPATDALRFFPRLGYWHDGALIATFPAMLAAVTSASGDLVAIHRTYLTDDGHKAPVPTVKKLTATAGPLMGASIKIGQPTPRPDGHMGLGIAEGIETSLAAAILFGVPVWAGVSAHGLASFTPPPRVRNVYVFGDNDKSRTGQKAAAQLAERLTRQGFTTRIHVPLTIGDWNDELIAREATV